MSYRLELIKTWRKLKPHQQEFMSKLWEVQENYAEYTTPKGFRHNTIEALEESGLVDRVSIKLESKGRKEPEHRIIYRLTKSGLALMYFAKSDWWMSDLNAPYKSPDKYLYDSLRSVHWNWNKATQTDETIIDTYTIIGFRITFAPDYCDVVAITHEESEKGVYKEVEQEGTLRHFVLPDEVLLTVQYLAELKRGKDKHMGFIR